MLRIKPLNRDRATGGDVIGVSVETDGWVWIMTLWPFSILRFPVSHRPDGRTVILGSVEVVFSFTEVSAH